MWFAFGCGQLFGGSQCGTSDSSYTAAIVGGMVAVTAVVTSFGYMTVVIITIVALVVDHNSPFITLLHKVT